MGQGKFKDVAIENYLAIEQEDQIRYEYHDGQLVRMAGGSINHSAICNNVAFALTSATRNTGNCKAFNSEMKLEIKRKTKYVYADAGASCPDFKESEHITGAITNPCLVVEVLSSRKWRPVWSVCGRGY